jgi:hypothetical protein
MFLLPIVDFDVTLFCCAVGLLHPVSADACVPDVAVLHAVAISLLLLTSLLFLVSLLLASMMFLLSLLLLSPLLSLASLLAYLYSFIGFLLLKTFLLLLVSLPLEAVFPNVGYCCLPPTMQLHTGAEHFGKVIKMWYH